MIASNIITMLCLALLDCLNPATITTLIMLLSIVRRKWYALIFVIGTFIVYFTAGILAYFGVDLYLKAFLVTISTRFSQVIGISEIVLGAGVLIYATIQATKLLRQIIARNVKVKDYMGMMVKKTNVVSIIFLSVASTLADLPTAFPYFGFVGILSVSDINTPILIMLFAIYCLIYTAPMLLIYALFAFFKGEKLQKIEYGFKHFMNVMCLYTMPLMLLLGGVFLIFDGVTKI